jgi:hypothetical protein
MELCPPGLRSPSDVRDLHIENGTRDSDPDKQAGSAIISGLPIQTQFQELETVSLKLYVHREERTPVGGPNAATNSNREQFERAEGINRTQALIAVGAT